jgi:beta-lactamase regulating signal transducer with metallopeptidase domain
MLCRLAVGLRDVHGLIAESTALSEQEETMVRRSADVPERVRLRESSLRVPVTAGVLAPVILLPAGWRDLSAREIVAILRHEGAHVGRGDYAWGVLAAFVCACFWFHPVVWVAAERLRWFAEVASDDEAAAAVGAHAYAAELIGLAERWSREPRVRYAVMVGAGSALARRVHLLLDGSGGAERRGLLVLAALTILMLGLSLSAIKIVPWRADATASLHIHQHQHGH